MEDGLSERNGNNGTVANCYWDTETSGQANSDGGIGKTTQELQSPTGYTGIYAAWNVDLDGDGTMDDPWGFGTPTQYPTLKGSGHAPDPGLSNYLKMARRHCRRNHRSAHASCNTPR